MTNTETDPAPESAPAATPTSCFPVGDVAAVGIRSISKRFGDVVAVDDLSLDIADGEFFALLGPSGCGKTTTLRMIAGLEFPTEGSLTIFGDEVGTLPANKRPVNTVFQNYALFPHLSVIDNVTFGLKMQGTPKKVAIAEAEEALSMVQLGAMSSRKPSQLSGGQQQRVALARALVNRPKVLLLDEPLGALDLKLRQEMQSELKALQRELGITFVFVTHDQEEALTMSDRIGVMHEGLLLQVGSPEEIYERPSNRFVADFIGHTNFLEGTVEDSTTVCLVNGTRIPVATQQSVGTSVAITLRPERATVHDHGDVPAGQVSVDGIVETVTYLGNAVVYQVKLDWMLIDCRQENRPAMTRYAPGDSISVSWNPAAVAVVAE